MKGSRVTVSTILILFLLPIFAQFSVGTFETEAYGENVKIGFSMINGLNGATEFIDAGYQRALEMGAQIEHRDYGWDHLNYTLTPIIEWKEFYLSKYPQLNTSLAINVIYSNSTTFAYPFSFTSYNTPGEAATRFNDTAVVNTLRNLTVDIMEIIDLDYISYGTEVNGFFESLFNYTDSSITNTVMLDDYIDLCEQLYEFVKTNYSDTQVLTIFRYQPVFDIENIEPIISRFDNTCDIYGLSCRIFTDDIGRLAFLNETEVLERFTDFTSLTSKNFAITNIYTISDSRHGGSPAYQGEFVRYLFNVIENYENDLEFICWYQIYDYPTGYLSLIYSPLLEPHSTAGLCTHNGDPKVSYYTWIEEMRAMGRLTNYLMPWKIGIGVTILIAISGFLVYAYVMEGIQFRKDLDKDKVVEEEAPKEISFEKEVKEKPVKKKKKKPKTIEFTDELNNE
ncbi:MAG: hypothetical protein KGD59_14580 [Candidatus Heimdallarchaeota archaeon]|nr:hypothetical protein [Candidatus Heimdallarchaeota archaeon]MBY8995774.1 hypothetical protein [Candidatus Heimdallarchaeota archaeon]